MSITTAARGLLSLCLASATFAQTVDPEVAKLENQLKIIELQKKIAEASAPKITGGLEGSTAFSGETPAEAVHLAYQSLAGIAEKMLDKEAGIKKCASSSERIMIFSSTEISAFENLSAFRLQSSILHDYLAQALRIDARIPPPSDVEAATFLGPMMVGPLIQSIIDVAKLFRVNREIISSDVTPDEKAFIGILASKIGEKRCKVFYPELVPASLFRELSFTPGTIPEKLDQKKLTELLNNDLQDWAGQPPSLSRWLQRVTFMTSLVRHRHVQRTKEKADLDQKIEKGTADLKKQRALAATIKPLTEALAKLEAKLKDAKPAEIPAVQKELAAKREELKEAVDAKAKLDTGDAQAALSRIEAYSAQLADLIELLTAARDGGNAYREALLKESGSGLTLLSRLTRSSRLEEQLKCESGTTCYSSILHVSIQKLTGSTLKKSNAFTGTRHTYSGGAIATFLQFGLWDGTKSVDGAILSSGTYTGYSGQYKPESEKTKGTITPGKLGQSGAADPER